MHYRRVSIPFERRGSVVENERDEQIDLVGHDPAVLDVEPCSLTQAPLTPRRVLLARSIPVRRASSKLSLDRLLISVTRATVPMALPPAMRDPTIGRGSLQAPNGDGLRRYRAVTVA